MAKATVAPVEVDQETAVAVSETNEVAVAMPKPVLGGASGEIDSGDIQLPTLRCIQKMSENPSKLDEGTLTLNNQTVIEDAKGNARIIVLTMVKYYREVLPFGAGIPKTFGTIEEALAEGYTLARSKEDRASGKPLVEDCARAVVLVEQPEGTTDRSFPIEIGGRRFAQAIWYIQASAYRDVAKVIFSKMAFELRQSGLLPAVWRLSTTEVKSPKGTFYAYRIALLDEENDEAFVNELKEKVTV